VRAQAQAIAAARNAGHQTAGSTVTQGFAQLSSGAAVAAAEIPFQSFPNRSEAPASDNGAIAIKLDWSKLPPKLARDLLEGSRENVSPEYRTAIETYFRVIAERARQRKADTP
jgi:hypothetical protein